MRIQAVCMLGGTGFLGRAVCERLAERGVRVRVVTRQHSRSRPLWVLPTLEVAVADPQDEVALAALFEDVDAVVNLCGILHETRGHSFEHVHADLPRKIVGACRAAGVRHLVHVSALGAAESGPSDYQKTKGRGEAAIREAGASLPWTILRPSVIFGAEDDFLNRFAALVRFLPFVPLAAAKARIQPIWVEDVARVLVAVLGDMDAFGQTYELCGPRIYSLEDIVRLVAQSTGRRRAVVPLPGALAAVQAFFLEHLPGKLLTRDNLRSLSVDNVCGGRFPRAFGFEPAPLESVAPAVLAGGGTRARYNRFRYRAGR